MSTIINYNELNLEQYFKKFLTDYNCKLSVEDVTKFFTLSNNFRTEKPYLYRRIIVPDDIRFKEITIGYQNLNEVRFITWDFSISLIDLVNIFGKYKMTNEPYCNSTSFTFSSSNPDVSIIKTRYPKWLTEDKDGFLIEDGPKKEFIKDPKFSFIQFDMSAS